MLEKKTGLLHAGFVVGLIGLTACGTGYREGAAAEAELGSEAHRQATFAIIRELHRSECMLFDGDDSCPAVGGIQDRNGPLSGSARVPGRPCAVHRGRVQRSLGTNHPGDSTLAEVELQAPPGLRSSDTGRRPVPTWQNVTPRRPVPSTASPAP